MAPNYDEDPSWDDYDTESSIPETPPVDYHLTLPKEGEMIDLEEIGDILAHIEADATQWREEEYRVESIQHHFRLMILRERVLQNPDQEQHEANQDNPTSTDCCVGAPQSAPPPAICVPTDPLQRRPWYLQPGSVTPQISYEQPQRPLNLLGYFAIFSMIIFLSDIAALALGVRQTTILRLLEHLFTPFDAGLLLMLGSVSLLVGYILIVLGAHPSDQHYPRLERNIVQFGIFVIASSFIGICSSLIPIDLNNLAGSLFLIYSSGGCILASRYIVNHFATQMHTLLRMISIGCLICGGIFWAVSLGSLLSYTLLIEADI